PASRQRVGSAGDWEAARDFSGHGVLQIQILEEALDRVSSRGHRQVEPRAPRNDSITHPPLERERGLAFVDSQRPEEERALAHSDSASDAAEGDIGVASLLGRDLQRRDGSLPGTGDVPLDLSRAGQSERLGLASRGGYEILEESVDFGEISRLQM